MVTAAIAARSRTPPELPPTPSAPPEMTVDGALGAADIDELLVEEAAVRVDESGEPELEIEAVEVVEAVDPATEEAPE